LRWKRWIGLIVFVAVGFGVYRVSQIANTLMLPESEEDVAAIRAIAEAQNEEAFYRPGRKPLERQEANPLKNAYFGDLHVHTDLSGDAFLFGNRFDVDTAYRMAKGESTVLRTGERVELTRPLDFAALTDHAESFGRRMACANPDLHKAGRKQCDDWESPSFIGFLKMRSIAQRRPPVRDLTVFNDDAAAERNFAAKTWQQIKDVAERHYEPGKFTTFAGYEYSPVLPDRGKHHRNIVFRSLETPKYAVSAFDAASEIDLWKQLEATCTGNCQFLTIPHNMNKTWGLAFSGKTIDGDSYTEDDWRLRERSEPIVEMFQIKGNSECSVAFGAGDEECGFEQFFPACEEGQKTSCIYPTSMVRDGLQKGLALEDEIGINPLKVGMIGSTDTHNSNPGDTEEWDYRGAVTFASSPAALRLNESNVTGIMKNNPGGLAAVWAPENTREALFDAMKRKEVYATSGTRIKLRTFAGFKLPVDIAATGDLAAAYEKGVPMGGSLLADENAEAVALSLFVWAVKDPDHAPLAKVQVIKGWIESGERQEVVHDIACGGSQLDPSTGKCEANGAKVNMNDCSWDNTAGASELKTLWTDPDYDSDEDAFYYVRVVQNPTCRWTTYDSLRLGREPPSDVPATVTEMAWGSPVWVRGRGKGL
jgi:hypothetical protein